MYVDCYTYKFNPKTLSCDKTTHRLTSEKLKHYEKMTNLWSSIAISVLILFGLCVISLVVFDIFKIYFPTLYVMLGFALAISANGLIINYYEDKIEKECQILQLLFYKKHSDEKKRAEMLLYDWCVRHPEVKFNADKFNISLYDAYVLTYHKKP